MLNNKPIAKAAAPTIVMLKPVRSQNCALMSSFWHMAPPPLDNLLVGGPTAFRIADRGVQRHTKHAAVLLLLPYLLMQSPWPPEQLLV